jgi:hypothetical protein
MLLHSIAFSKEGLGEWLADRNEGYPRADIRHGQDRSQRH